MFKKTKIKIGAAIASGLMGFAAIGTSAGIISNNSQYQTKLKTNQFVQNGNLYNQPLNFAVENNNNIQSSNSLQTLNNITFSKGTFSQTQLKQIDNIINNQTYNLQGNGFAAVNSQAHRKITKFMRSVQTDVINHIQQNGLQKGGLTKILTDKYHVSKSWLEANSQNNPQNQIDQLKTNLERINADNVNLSGFNKDYIVQGLNLAQKEENYITQFSSNSNLQNQAKSLLQEITSKYNWMLKYQSWNWNASWIYSTFKQLVQNMQNLYNEVIVQIQTDKANESKLQQEISNIYYQLQKINANDTNGCNFNKDYIVDGLNLAQKEEAYSTQFSSDTNLQNQAKSLLQEITSKYNWMLKYQSWGWDASVLYNEFQVSISQMQNLYESAVRANLGTENVSFVPTAYLQAWIDENYSAWNYGARLNLDDTSSIIAKFNAAVLAQPWNFYKITINNKAIPNSVYFCFIKSIKLISINNNQYKIRIWTKPNLSLNQTQNFYYNGELEESIFDDNITAKTIELSKPEKQNILKNEISQYKSQINSEISENNIKLQEVKAALSTLQTDANNFANYWLLRVLQCTWSYDSKINKAYQNAQNEVSIINNLGYGSVSIKKYNKWPMMSPALKINKQNLNLNQPDSNLMSLKRNLTWDERTYVVNSNTNNEIKDNAINLWSEMNTYYHQTLNAISWGEDSSTSYNQFNKFIGQLENLYLAVTQPAKMGLAIMENGVKVINKFAEQEMALAIADSVATGISIALAVAYWAGAWCFGITVPDAIAATASAAATTVAMGLMWSSYAKTVRIEKDIESGISKWLYYSRNAVALTRPDISFAGLKKSWRAFKNLFTQKFSYNVRMVEGVITVEEVTVDACAWADPILTVIQTANDALLWGIIIANIAISGTNDNWINLVY